MDGTTVELDSGDRSRSKNGEDGGYFDTEAEEVSQVEEAESRKRECPPKRNCSSSARSL